jgi:Raf kinase inhibitor-like YbhB/YbcL family protein
MGFALSDLQLTSPAFTQGGAIPARHTGEGEDLSPELSWTQTPAGTRSLAVICHDPDAPLVSVRGSYGFVHWVLYNISGNETGLPEGVTDFTAGKNDFGRMGYGGPMPPPGHGIHHYFFWLLALRHAPQLPQGLTQVDLLKRIEPSLIGMNRLVGTYLRS